MKKRRIWQALLGLTGLVILLLGLSACSPQAEPTEDPPSAEMQGKNITVYESPT